MTYHYVASQQNYRDHLHPMLDGHPSDAHMHNDNFYVNDVVDGDVIVTASQRDFMATKHLPGRHVYMEHGVGLQVHKRSSVLALNKYQPLVLVPNWYTYEELDAVHCTAPKQIVGTPKMDKLVRVPFPGAGVVAVSFHWTGHGRNYIAYRKSLKQLAATHQVIGHGHPKAWSKLKLFWEELGIEPVEDFREVVERADVYACDHSSTIYEWAALDRPVILLNRTGEERSRFTALRYGDFDNVGAKASPATLLNEVDFALDDGLSYGQERLNATAELFPHIGFSTQVALERITGKYYANDMP